MSHQTTENLIQEVKEKKSTHLSLRGLNLTELPESIFELIWLQSLDLSHNQIDDISHIIRRIDKLSNLIYLNLSHNQITDISSAYRLLKEGMDTSIEEKNEKQKGILISNNPIVNPPIEIIKGGREAIINYFEQIQNLGENTTKLYEAKILIVGDPRTGKTTLAKTLCNLDYRLPSLEVVTKGIEILKYQFPVKGTINTKFTVNIWTFGGQEIYHSLDHLFFSQNSLFILVLDPRVEYNNIHQWLHTISIYGGNSPIIIVSNKSDLTLNDSIINYNHLKETFSTIASNFHVSLKNQRGINILKEEIEKQLLRLPNVGDLLPKKWLKLKERLEETDEKYLSLDIFLDISSEYGFNEEQSRLVSKYLHDIGTIFHFQEDLILDNIIILNPIWLTNAIFRVLDSPNLRKQGGKVYLKDITQIWKQNHYPRQIYSSLIRLMEIFQLCYKLKKNIFIFPQLLSVIQPNYTLPEGVSIQYKFVYQYLPKEIITRLVVRLNSYIIDNLVWRTGFVLKLENSTAIVEESTINKEFSIQSFGDQKYKIIELIRHELSNIHKDYHALKFEENISCNCSECLVNHTPQYYSRSFIENAFEKNISEIRCHKSFESIDVYSLLYGLDISSINSKNIISGSNIHVGDIINYSSNKNQLFDVFISYNNVDRDVVRTISNALKEEGLNIWWDEWNLLPGMEIKTEIHNAIKGSKNIVVCFGRQSLNKFQLREIENAIKENKKIIPIVLYESESLAHIPKSITQLSFIKFFDKKSDPISKLIYGITGNNSFILKSTFRIKELKRLISENKIIEVFADLHLFIPESSKHYNDIIILKSRYNNLKNKVQLGTLNLQIEYEERTKINYALLNLLDELDRSTIKNELENLEEKVESNPNDFESWKSLVKIYNQLGDYNKAEKAKLIFEDLKETNDFINNKSNPVQLEKLKVENINFFNNFEWELQPKMNVLLGKNGYGKSQLLRLIASMLYKSDERTQDFFRTKKSSTSKITFFCIQQNKLNQIERTHLVFTDHIGKVPILAIPDLRFVNKSKTLIELIDTENNDLSQFGAYEFLHQVSYENTIQNFLYGLCNDYMEAGKKFDPLIFQLITDAFQKLTGTTFKFHEIKRIGSVNFEMEVITDGNLGSPLPIQKASQGTLSVLSIIGLIYRFLKELFPTISEHDINKQRAIVIIDEVDAHLHPSWQQKIVRILQEAFPSVQFVISAHSPLVVAGCKELEVSVLRKSEKGFTIEQFNEDFIGYEVEKLYRKIFEIEDTDETYKSYIAMIPQEKELRKELKQLQEKEYKEVFERNRINILLDIIHYIEKTKLRNKEKQRDTQLERENRRLKSEIRKLKNQINRT